MTFWLLALVTAATCVASIVAGICLAVPILWLVMSFDDEGEPVHETSPVRAPPRASMEVEHA